MEKNFVYVQLNVQQFLVISTIFLKTILVFFLLFYKPLYLYWLYLSVFLGVGQSLVQSYPSYMFMFIAIFCNRLPVQWVSVSLCSPKSSSPKNLVFCLFIIQVWSFCIVLACYFLCPCMPVKGHICSPLSLEDLPNSTV